MFKDFIDSFRGNITRRVTNPFLGTFVAVFLIYYWKPIYAILTFDNNATLVERISYLENYFGDFSWLILGKLILITFSSLLLTYLLLSISYVISNTYNKKVIPIILNKIDNSSIVTREDHERTQNLLEAFSNKYTSERKKVITLQSELEDLRQELQSRNDDKSKIMSDEKEAQIDKDLVSKKSSSKVIESQKETTEDRLFKIAYADIKDSGFLGEFIRAANGRSGSRLSFNDNKLIELLSEYNILKIGEKGTNRLGENFYIDVYFTPLGKSFLKYAIDRYSDEID